MQETTIYADIRVMDFDILYVKGNSVRHIDVFS